MTAGLPSGPEDAVAIESADAVWTFGELEAATTVVADALADALADENGAALTNAAEEPRPRIGHVFGLSPEAIVAVHGIARAGAVLAPAHVDCTEAQARSFEQAVEPDAILTSPGLRWPGARDRRALDVPGFGPLEILRLDRSAPRNSEAPAGTDVMISTSGSGGAPRVVCHSWAGLRANARSANVRSEATSEAVTLATLAWAHIGGLAIVIRAAENGSRIACGPPRFDAAEVIEAINRHSVTHVSLVPVMLERVLDTGSPSPSTLARVLLGGAATADRLLDRAQAAGWPISLTYGLTEAGSQVSTASPTDVTRNCGRGVLDHPLPGVEIKVGEDDEVAVWGPSLMTGYLGEPSPPDSAGWLRTGDLAARDAGGALDIIGRLGDRIVTGGTNVDPVEVESALLEHEAVREVCVVGTPDDTWGQVVAALVVLEEGYDGEDLGEWARDRLGSARVPRRWRFVDRLPQTATGKIDRAAARAASHESGE